MDTQGQYGAKQTTLPPRVAPKRRERTQVGDAKSSLGDAKSSLGDAKSSLGDVLELAG